MTDNNTAHQKPDSQEGLKDGLFYGGLAVAMYTASAPLSLPLTLAGGAVTAFGINNGLSDVQGILARLKETTGIAGLIFGAAAAAPNIADHFNHNALSQEGPSKKEKIEIQTEPRSSLAGESLAGFNIKHDGNGDLILEKLSSKSNMNLSFNDSAEDGSGDLNANRAQESKVDSISIDPNTGSQQNIDGNQKKTATAPKAPGA